MLKSELYGAAQNSSGARVGVGEKNNKEEEVVRDSFQYLVAVEITRKVIIIDRKAVMVTSLLHSARVSFSCFDYLDSAVSGSY
jgi:hypothetical protein